MANSLVVDWLKRLWENVNEKNSTDSTASFKKGKIDDNPLEFRGLADPHFGMEIPTCEIWILEIQPTTT